MLTDALLLGLLGLLVGSFLNVVIHRLPKMLERQWAAECKQLTQPNAAPSAPPDPASPPRYNLMVPRSACPHCGHTIRWFENIPVLSYAWLKGRCSACRAPISARYPLIEAATAALFAWCGWRWGLGPQALAWAAFSATLLCAAAIDWDTTLLPDDLTLPLVWGGLVAAATGITSTGLEAALWGAVAGYLSLWAVFWAFKLATGKEGMGYGDFKLFAALGAWMGWEALVPMILLASVVGALAGVAIKLRGELREGGFFPFGPFLAMAGLLAMVYPPFLTALR